MAAASASSPRRAVVVLLVLAAIVVAADQYTKQLALQRLQLGAHQPLFSDVIGLQLVLNPGAAFSLATGMTWVFTLVAVLVVAVVIRAARRMTSLGWALALGLLLGGALGNLYDRLFRPPGFARGHVVDFISYYGWFVGNIADIAIVLAALAIVLLAFRGTELDGLRAGGTTAAATGDETVGPAPEEADLTVAGDVTIVGDVAEPGDVAAVDEEGPEDYQASIELPSDGQGIEPGRRARHREVKREQDG